MTWQVRYWGEACGNFCNAHDAAARVATIGDGASIYHGEDRLWTEGEEDQPASESYDHVAEVVQARLDDKQSERQRQTNGASHSNLDEHLSGGT
jgi:hypothetical protein